ncbi:hypothetical protein [Saccharopolyspora rosea]|uniref:Endonuclease n=1 Tax=Saccharopolyspora rosea TaxID=524884 RepID=A0ABW3G4G0_9PSEU|nr:hypothetical protein [Saccharopolyspora rosea]
MSAKKVVQNLLEQAGTTFAAEAGIKLENKPSQLYRLLVMAVLLSTRIKAGIALSAARELREVPRLGPVGVDIFCREAQAVWPELRPYFDKKALSGADKLGLPTAPDRLAEFVDGPDLARLAAALVRVTTEKGLADEVRAA